MNSFASDRERIASFGSALDTLWKEVRAEMGEEDAVHILRIGRASRRLEIAGRGLIHFSFEPLGFGLGVAALSAHKCLELMEIGHMALHGCYDGLPGAERYRAESFHWKAPIDERSWQRGHNIRHHQYANVEGRDPDLTMGRLRLSSHVAHRRTHALQPLTNLLTWFGFANAINLHVTGVLDIYFPPTGAPSLPDTSANAIQAAKRAAVRKFLRYHAREYLLFPALAGPFFWKTVLGNALSEVGRDVYAGAVIYCGHVGARDYPRGTRAKGRAEWYRMQAEGARDIRVPHAISILCGGLDRQIEHHLFPHMPPNRLREIAPRVKAICEEHGVHYLEQSWPRTLADVLRQLRRLGSPERRELATTTSAA
jgi:linoleoyl-CoA desaturase